MAEAKTNAMRILERMKIEYKPHQYSSEGGIDGCSVAQKLNQPPEQVFKTLVTKGKTGHYVFVIPVDRELDLKKAAKSVGEKSVEMLPVKDLLSVTGYIRGGCSPLGMKKAFPTVIHSSAEDFKTIMVSGGRIGLQVELSPKDLAKAASAVFSEIIHES